MGFRFRKSKSLLGGLLRINLSKSGLSASVGPRGASVSVGKRGVHGNVGIPGTGLSYRTGNLAAKKKTNRGPSKKDRALLLYATNPGLSRREMINLFVQELGCAASTASNYYSAAQQAARAC